ncbi:DUF2971 domain-containing protein [Vibrio parahaemolyticus]|uniref:DUF2971 domain-containing protein n=1 Tax=Vibrio parahaemolyticus TaxID=670 RepID=UPI00248FA357|nr:DUF2971 domain-containing protein [Vibrio parahaemolyticus]
MLKSLYKYFPDRPEFFDNFLIRATTKGALNDPFEVNPSVDYWTDLSLDHNPHLSRVNVRNRYIEMRDSKQQALDYGYSLYRKYGIVSLTECRDNLLMWSHYANEHKGMAVEFDVTHDFFNSMHTDGNDLVGQVTRVSYRKQRIVELGDYILEPYFVKSDEWQYEKEHRLLLPIQKASKYWVNCSDKQFTKLEQKHDLKVVEMSIVENTPFHEIIHREGASLALDYPSVMCMFEVPKLAIKSITFGCKSDIAFMNKVLTKVSNNGLNNVQIYRAKQDVSDFKIYFEHNATNII